MVAGNHEDGTDPQMDGYIDNFIATSCLPNQFSNFVGSGLCPGTSTCYGKEGYFDYPLDLPIARFIMIANALKIYPTPTTNSTYIYDYCPLSACQKPSFDQRYQWLKQTIDAAKAAGYWVIVIQHKPCLSSDTATFCEGDGIYNGQNPGAQLLSVEISEGVDLVLSGHAHIYARSKQLTCYGTVQPNDGPPPAPPVYPSHQSSCIANDGSTGTYTKGAGLVQVIQGDFSQRDGLLNFTRPDINYFATAMSANGPSAADCCWVNGKAKDENSGNGIGVITLTPQTLIYTRQMSGQPSHQGTTSTTFSDSFTIVSSNRGSVNYGIWLVTIASGIVAVAILATFLVVRRERRRRQVLKPARPESQ
jgi:hypothetical protein